MPNHVSTNLTVTGDAETLKKFRETHIVTKFEQDYEGNDVLDSNGEKVPYECFDFNTVIPIHDDLYKVVSPPRNERDIGRIQESSNYTDEEKVEKIAEIKEQMALAKNNLERFGHSNWYDFCCTEWGTKWGAYDLHIEQDDDEVLRVFYMTAWSPATPVLNKLAEMYPSLSFEMSVLDEGMGFGGTIYWEGGSFYHEDSKSGKALFDFANKEFNYDWGICEGCGEMIQGDECWSCQNKENA
jgi:hypothetical protein